MTSQEAALVRVASTLAGLHIPYMIIGGMANIFWGEPRATLDIDATVWVEEPEIPATIRRLAEPFRPLVGDPVAFVNDTRVLPCVTPEQVQVDLVFGLLPFEEEAILRAHTFVVRGTDVRVCSAEDLILMKMVSERPRDLEDARGVTLRRFPSLDFAYLEPRVRQMAELLEDSAIGRRWEEWRREAAQQAGPRARG